MVRPYKLICFICMMLALGLHPLMLRAQHAETSFEQQWLRHQERFSDILFLDSLEKNAEQPLKALYNLQISNLLKQRLPGKGNARQPRTDLRNLEEWSTPELKDGILKYADSAFTQLLAYGWIPASDYTFLFQPGNVRFLPEMTLYDLALMSYLQSWKGYYELNRMEWIDHAMEKHMAQNHHNILIEYELCKLYLQSSYMDKESELKGLMALEERYGMEPAIEYEKGLYWYSMSEYQSNLSDSARNLYLGNCKACFEQVLRIATDSFYVANALAMLDFLNRPELTMSRNLLPQYMAPAAKILLPIKTYRNIDTLYLSIFDIDTTKIKTEILIQQPFLRQQRFVLHNPTPGAVYSTDLWLDSLPLGNYRLLYHVDPEPELHNILMTNDISITNIHVRQIVSEKKVAFVFTDMRTGLPIPGLKVTGNKKRHQYHYRTNRQGRISISGHANNNLDNLFIQETADSKLLLPMSFFDGFYEKNYKEKRWEAVYDGSAKIILDRELYRPGQQVHYKIYLYDGLGRLLTGQKAMVQLMNYKGGSWQTIEEKEMKSNEFGTISGTFQLPDNLYGRAEILVVSDNIRTWIYDAKYFEIANYKLPSFKLEFDDMPHSALLGETVTFSGRAVTYTGYPVADAQVVVHITDGLVQPRMEPVCLYLRTDADGRFHFDVETDSCGSDDSYRTVNVMVTDKHGESCSAEQSFYVNKNAFGLYYYISDLNIACQDSLISEVDINSSLPIKYDMVMETEIFKLTEPAEQRPLIYRDYQYPTQAIYTEEEYQRYFPDFSFDHQAKKMNNWPEEKQLCFQTDTIHQKRYLLKIDVKNWEPGVYKSVVKATDQQGHSNTNTSYFRVVDTRQQTVSQEPLRVDILSRDKHAVQISVASQFKNAVVFVELYKSGGKISRQLLMLNNEQKILTFPVSYKEVCAVFCYMNQHNLSYHSEKEGWGKWWWSQYRKHIESSVLGIHLTHWNSLLSPGKKEHWEMEVKNKSNGKCEPVEVLAWMIDSSLLSLGIREDFEHRLTSTDRKISDFYRKANNARITLQYSCNSRKYSWPVIHNQEETALPYIKQYDMLQFAGKEGISHPYIHQARIDNHIGFTRMSGKGVIKTPGRSISSDMYFDADNTSSQTMLRRIDNSSSDASEMGKSANYNTNRIRSRFEETAFFYPHLRTGKDGKLSFDFTMPDQLTTWRFYAVAHSRKQHAGNYVCSAISWLPFMLQSNAPQFLREGDTLCLQAKLANRSGLPLSGTVTATFFDPESQKALSLWLNPADSVQRFTVDSAAVITVAWKIAVPEGISSVAYRILAQAGDFGDGEENRLPVLPNRTLVTESQCFTLSANHDTAITFQRYRDYHSSSMSPVSYTLEFTANPMWYVLQTMPSLMWQSKGCNDHVFAQLFGAATVRHILSQHPELEAVFQRWRSDSLNHQLDSPLQRNDEFHSIMLEETPWLYTAQNESKQFRENAELFSFANLDKQLQKSFNKLIQNQLREGGWDWYGQYYYSAYTTHYILTGFYKLLRLGIKLPFSKLNGIIDNTIQRTDRFFEDKYQFYLKQKEWDAQVQYDYDYVKTDIQYLYMRSFKGIDTAWLSKDYVQHLFLYATKDIDKQSYANQAQLSMILYRMGREDEAKNIVESLRKKAVKNPEIGMYWPCESNKWGYGQSAVAQQALMIEAFTEISPKQEELEAMRQWLLLQKKGNDWGDIKSSVVAIYALLLNSGEKQIEPSSAYVKVGNEMFSDNRDSGTGYVKHVWTADEMNPKMADIEIYTDSIHPVYGACYWQYLEDVDKVESAGGELYVKRTLLHQPKNSGDKYEPVTAENPVRVGERVTVHIAIYSKKDIAFVYMKDPYIAAFVPTDIHERQGCGGTDVSWVQSPRQASISFFFNLLLRGTTVVEYELMATHSGTFTLGPTTIECEYAPEYRAQGDGGKVEVVGQ